MREFATYHHLRACSNPADQFTVLAIDHRGNLLESMQKARGKPVTRDEVIAFKRAVIEHLAPVASAVLTDPDYGFPALVESRAAGTLGLIAPLEITDYSLHPSQRQTAFIPNWSVAHIKAAGGDGVKLLLYYHPEAPNAASQTELVDRIVEQCQAARLPFFLEPISYSLDPDQSLTSAEKQHIVIESARHFTQRGVDVLKLEFPLDVTEVPQREDWGPVLAQLNEVCTVPWTLLSAGVGYDTFLQQAAAAAQAGCSGVMVGRAVWAEALALQGAALDEFLRDVARPRLAALGALTDLYGTPWTTRHAVPQLETTWWQSAQIPDAAE